MVSAMALWRRDERFEEVPEWLRELLEVVLADFQKPTMIDLLVGRDERGVVWFSEPGESGRAGFGAAGDGPGSASIEWLVDVAYWLQDQVFPETKGAWGEPRPRCPGHSHPMVPEVRDGEAWWACPRDGRAVFRVGQFEGCN